VTPVFSRRGLSRFLVPAVRWCRRPPRSAGLTTREAHGRLRPLRALAAELVGIYRDAPTLEDEEFAAEAIDDFLDSLDDDSDDEALVALLDLPETELTAALIDDVISMLADTGSRVVERLLSVALTGLEPTASRALDALDRMDGPDKADGLYHVLAGRGPEDLRRTAADELVALGHAGTSRLQDAFDDPWASELVQAAVAAAGGAGSSPAPLVEDSLAVAHAFAAAPAGDPPPPTGDPPPPTGDPPGDPPPTDDSSAAPVGDSLVGPARPLGPGEDVLEAEYRAFLERFERESGV
jgi:hypothetical protein